MLAKREKETCNPPKPIVQSLVIEEKSDSNAVQKQQSSNADLITGAQLKPTMEAIPVSTISDQIEPVTVEANLIVQTMGSEKTVSNLLDSVSQIPKLKVNRSRQRKKQLKRKVKMLPVLKQGNEESMSNTKIFLENLFKFLIAFIKAITSIMNSPTGILWGIVFLLAVHPQLIKGSPVPSGEISSHSSHHAGNHQY